MWRVQCATVSHSNLHSIICHQQLLASQWLRSSLLFRFIAQFDTLFHLFMPLCDAKEYFRTTICRCPHSGSAVFNFKVMWNINFCFQTQGGTRWDVADKMLDYLWLSRLRVCACACVGVCRGCLYLWPLVCRQTPLQAPCTTAFVLIYGSSRMCPTSPSLGDLGWLIIMYSGWLPWKRWLVGFGGCRDKDGAPAVHVDGGGSYLWLPTGVWHA